MRSNATEISNKNVHSKMNDNPHNKRTYNNINDGDDDCIQNDNHAKEKERNDILYNSDDTNVKSINGMTEDATIDKNIHDLSSVGNTNENNKIIECKLDFIVTGTNKANNGKFEEVKDLPSILNETFGLDNNHDLSNTTNHETNCPTIPNNHIKCPKNANKRKKNSPQNINNLNQNEIIYSSHNENNMKNSCYNINDIKDFIDNVNVTKQHTKVSTHKENDIKILNVNESDIKRSSDNENDIKILTDKENDIKVSTHNENDTKHSSDNKNDMKLSNDNKNDITVLNDNENNINETNDSEIDLCKYLETSEIRFKFVGAFRSFRDKPLKNGRRWSLDYEDNLESGLKPEADVSRSEYSLVSCNDLTAGAVQLWMGLPEEVKYDPALAPFRQFYEKEHGQLQSKIKNVRHHRLPSVNSAPHLNNNHVNFVSEEPYIDERKEPSEDHHSFVQKTSMLQKAGHYTKMTVLIACWLFFTLAFLMYNEKEVVTRNSSVAPFEVKSYVLSNNTSPFSVLLEVSGPFLSETAELSLNSSVSTKKMELWVERQQDGNHSVVQTSDSWKIILQEEEDLDFSVGEPRSATLKLEPFAASENTTVFLRMRSTSNHTTPFSMSYTLSPLDVSTGVIYATVLLLGLYILIIFEVINRTMAAILISTSALATLALVGERPTLPEIVSWLDIETLLLLFSMMLLVSIMAETGMFDFLAVFTFEVTKGKLWPLIGLLCAFTAVISTFLDNVTTVLLMTPVTIRLCEVMDLDPIPILMSMVLFSNIGGTATPVGDPPNVIIASNKAVTDAGINFTNFTVHMTVGILLVCVQTYVQLRFIFRDANKLRLNEHRDIQDLRHQISIWRRAAESLPHLSRDEHVVRERLERKAKKLTAQLDVLIKESNKRACPKDTFKSTLAEMKDKYKIRDKVLLIKATVAITFVVVVFFLHSIPELNRVSLGWTALLGALLLLALADRADLEPVLHRVEWSTLLFFAALFVLMEALSKLGLISFIGGLTESLILSVDESARLAVAILLMLWVSGVSSAFVDNIPLTTMMVRVVTSLGSNPALNLPMQPLIWALSFGACLGGNGTIIGASANVVCAGVAEQHGYKFTFMQFFKIGFPVMIGHLVVASGYLLMCHCVFTWH